MAIIDLMAAGVYLHIPFCKSRCSYCDFATDVYRDSDAVEKYVDALCFEIGAFDTSAIVRTASVRWRNGHSTQPPYLATFKPPTYAGGSDIDTVYLGGGTPSLLSPRQVEKILRSVDLKFNISPDAELTMEMNPATLTTETLRSYRSLGINRASFGVQTFDDRALKLLARGHDASDARQTFAMLRDTAFDNVSFDLIAGLPNQTLRQWEQNLDEAIKLSPEHLSLYLLEIHEGTPLAEQVRSGRQPQPDEDLAAQMYEVMLAKLAAVGYAQYEISNFARPGFESHHNSKYWRLEPVYGFGVSAHSFDSVQRYSNERDTAKYIELIETSGSAEVTREEIDAACEFAFLGLRLEEGIDLPKYEKHFGIDLEQRYGAEIDRLRDAGLLAIDNKRMWLTPKGKLFSNEVFAVFV